MAPFGMKPPHDIRSVQAAKSYRRGPHSGGFGHRPGNAYHRRCWPERYQQESDRERKIQFHVTRSGSCAQINCGMTTGFLRAPEVITSPRDRDTASCRPWLELRAIPSLAASDLPPRSAILSRSLVQACYPIEIKRRSPPHCGHCLWVCPSVRPSSVPRQSERRLLSVYW
jgi:hypothetical protein